MTNRRNASLELIKLFAAYMVVLIHVRFPGQGGMIIKALGRFAVPLFFVVSGFFSYRVSGEKIKKRIFHLLRLFALATAVYTLWNLLWAFRDSKMAGVKQYLAYYTGYISLAKLFIFNVTNASKHIWYLPASIYVYMLYLLCIRWKVKDSVIFGISGLLLLAQLALGEGLSLLGRSVPFWAARNFIFMGIPFFGLGLLARKYVHKLQSLSGSAVFLCIAAGIGETVLSYLLFGSKELYTGSLLILLGLMAIAVQNEEKTYPKALTDLSSCGTYIYIFHVLLSQMLLKVYAAVGLPLSMAVQIAHPLLICLLSTAFAFCINSALSPRRQVSNAK